MSYFDSFFDQLRKGVYSDYVDAKPQQRDMLFNIMTSYEFYSGLSERDKKLIERVNATGKYSTGTDKDPLNGIRKKWLDYLNG